MLCTSALPLASNKQERLEFVDEIIRASDMVVESLDHLEQMPDHWISDEPTSPG